jgi:hypothetical protein
MTKKVIDRKEMFETGGALFHPGFSIDCVILGFIDNKLRVLLVKRPIRDQWALPGGFVYKAEDVDEAAGRILATLTGLKDVYLQQFRLFGHPTRSETEYNRKYLDALNVEADDHHWFLQRFITMGYYALIDCPHYIPVSDNPLDKSEWWDVTALPEMMLDHGEIVKSAMETLRMNLNFQPIGCKLLPEKFTLSDLQTLYEIILGKTLDRRNFRRKIQSQDILIKLPEVKEGVAHKAPSYYKFNHEKYNEELSKGFE